MFLFKNLLTLYILVFLTLKIFPTILTAALVTGLVYNRPPMRKVVKIVQNTIGTYLPYSEPICQGALKNGQPCKFRAKLGNFCAKHAAVPD